MADCKISGRRSLCPIKPRLIIDEELVRPISGTVKRVSSLASLQCFCQIVRVLGRLELCHGPKTELEHFRLPSAVATIWAINCIVVMSMAANATTSATVDTFCSMELIVAVVAVINSRREDQDISTRQSEHRKQKSKLDGIDCFSTAEAEAYQSVIGQGRLRL